MSGCCSFVDRLDDLIDIVRNLRKQDDIRTAGNSGMKCQPANFVSHNFNQKYTVVGCCCGVDAVDRIRCDVNSTLETECHIRSINIIVDRLWQMDDIQSFFTQQVCCLLCSISPKDHQTVQAQFVIILFHGFYFIQSVLVRCTHQLERLSGGSQDRSALCQDSGKIFC